MLIGLNLISKKVKPNLSAAPNAIRFYCMAPKRLSAAAIKNVNIKSKLKKILPLVAREGQE